MHCLNKMPTSQIVEDYKPLKLKFLENDKIVIIPTIGDGNCYFHSVLRAFNSNYINAKTIFDRVNMARTFRNALADRLIETDPLTGNEYYFGLNNGKLEEISEGVREYTKESLRKELLSSNPVDNIYQELISNAINKDIYIIDSETKDVYYTGSAFSLYYKGRNSIVVYYSPGHFEVIGIKHSDGSVDTLFTPEHALIRSCNDRLLDKIRVDKKKTPRAASPSVSFDLQPQTTKSRASSPVRERATSPSRVLATPRGR